MKENFTGAECERAPDLVAFLYGEASPEQALSFERHMRDCASCRSDLVAFSSIRGSVGAWRSEALGSTIGSHQVIQEQKPAIEPSAVAAIREFFRLSPLWMKGAVALASLVFCALAVLAIARVSNEPSTPPIVQVDEKSPVVEEKPTIVKSEENREEKAGDAEDRSLETKGLTAREPKISPRTTNSRNTIKPRRLQLTQEEREQLAADLRLISLDEDLELDLLGDGVNQE